MPTQLQLDPLPTTVAAESTPGLVAVAMSGGVDSSTVAAVLLEQNRPIVGLTMQLWNQRRLPELQGDGTQPHPIIAALGAAAVRRAATTALASA